MAEDTKEVKLNKLGRPVGGRPKHPRPNYIYKDISQIKSIPSLQNKHTQWQQLLNAKAVASVISTYLMKTRTGIKEALSNADTPMLDVAICSILARAAKEGDQHKLEFLLNRVIGKVADRIETISFDERALEKLNEVPTEMLLQAIFQAQEKVEAD